jgi:hypothetical protein
MKKLFLSMGIVALSAMAFANPPKKGNSDKLYNYAASQSLYQMYGKVESLSWRLSGDKLFRADYVIDGEKFSSFFDLDGTFVATTAVIKLEEIPAKIRKNIQAKLGSKEIRNILHYATETEITYFVETLEYGKDKVYRVSPNGSISRFK